MLKGMYHYALDAALCLIEMLQGHSRSVGLNVRLLKKKENDQLRRKVAGKQKMFDFGPFDLKYVKIETGSVKQQMKIVVIVNGSLQGVMSKTGVPPSNVASNQWVQNMQQDRPALSRRSNRWKR